MLPIPANCVAHCTKLSSFSVNNLFRFISNFLISWLKTFGLNPFASAHFFQNVGHVVLFMMFIFAAFSLHSCSSFASQSEIISAIVSKLKTT